MARAREETGYSIVRHKLDALQAVDYNFNGAEELVIFASVEAGFPASQRVKININDGADIFLNVLGGSPRHIIPKNGRIYKFRLENLVIAAGEHIAILQGIAFPT